MTSEFDAYLAVYGTGTPQDEMQITFAVTGQPPDVHDLYELMRAGKVRVRISPASPS